MIITRCGSGDGKEDEYRRTANEWDSLGSDSNKNYYTNGRRKMRATIQMLLGAAHAQRAHTHTHRAITGNFRVNCRTMISTVRPKCFYNFAKWPELLTRERILSFAYSECSFVSLFGEKKRTHKVDVKKDTTTHSATQENHSSELIFHGRLFDFCFFSVRFLLCCVILLICVWRLRWCTGWRYVVYFG